MHTSAIVLGAALLGLSQIPAVVATPGGFAGSDAFGSPLESVDHAVYLKSSRVLAGATASGNEFDALVAGPFKTSASTNAHFARLVSKVDTSSDIPLIGFPSAEQRVPHSSVSVAGVTDGIDSTTPLFVPLEQLDWNSIVSSPNAVDLAVATEPAAAVASSDTTVAFLKPFFGSSQ
ncbi:uncharacterized protein BJ171DRAFT_489897 [Polychytrium aggregatum]|uniref:uncharacterized protein n=1 Tax=Polychytrium aggregatum TaxID=110093 RepID=UPI0022FEE0AD|nr:uncharacterized protein BJ171DRAFT_489897 [Polychytrium aggregatum]KAI9208758.1 hypothetical protein BJ171DRAFT_489897 [Polychytrium aggregatum]